MLLYHGLQLTIESEDESRPGRRHTHLYEIEPDPAGGWHLTQKLGARRGAEYRVWLGADGAALCTCPDAVYRKHTCKHAEALLDLGLLSVPTPTPPRTEALPPGRAG